MDTIELGEIIATRDLNLINPDSTTSAVIVAIGKPNRFTDSPDFFTPYRITGVGKEEIWYAAGVDAVQSLQLVMGMIDAELKALVKDRGVKLMWLDDESLGFGFAPLGSQD